jgi:DNA-binding beta-propeller fold protein YncE
MVIRALVRGALLSGLCMVASVVWAQPAGTLLVVNRAGGSISYIDLETATDMARLPVGPVIPHEVAVSPDGSLALTAEYGPESRHGQHLVLLDVVNPRILRRIDVGPGTRPHSVLFMPDGRRAVTTAQDADELLLVDVMEGRVLRRYPTGGREGHMVRLSPDARRAYVTNRGAAGDLSVIFLEENRDPVVIPTGEGAEGLAVSPDGGEVWVVNRLAESISIVDAERLEVVAVVPARLYAGRAEISRQGRVAVPNGGSGAAAAQFLSVYDLGSRALRVELPMRQGERAAGSFGMLIVDETLFVGDRGGARVLRYDLAALGEPLELATNHEEPDGLAWSPLRLAVFSQ